MSPDIVAQLHSYLETIETAAPPITVDELERVSVQQIVRTEDVVGADPARSRPIENSPVIARKPLGVRALAALAAVVVVMVGSLVWLLGSGDESSSVVTQPPVPAPSLPEPTNTGPATNTIPATTTAPAVLPPPVLEASRVPHDESVFGSSIMSSVASSEGRFVAVGATGRINPSGTFVWVSDDGRSWTRHPDDESVFDGALGRSVVSYGEGFVVVGSDDCTSQRDEPTGDSCTAGSSAAAVWISFDGVVLERLPHDESVFGGDGDQFMISAVEYNGGLVAVGSSSGSGAVWASPDGLTWARVSSDEPVFERSEMVDVVRFGEGLVAVGLDSSCCDGDADALVWTSADGVEWERVPHDETVFGGDGDQIMASVASSGGRLVAVGFDQGGLGDAAVWTSEDGLTWTRVPHDESVFGAGDGGGAEMTSVEALGEGFVAGGLQQIEGLDGDMDAVVWTTSDGLTWARVSADDAVFGGDQAQRIHSIAVNQGDVIAVGGQHAWGPDSMNDPDAAVWTLTP